MVQQRTFFQRFGHHGICVLPADVLSDDPLFDPDTGEDLPSLREQISLVNGIYHHLLCYARVLRACGDGLYWADVAATIDFVNTERVVLTEEDLYSALPYDIRVQDTIKKNPTYILKLMEIHAREVRPLQRVEPGATLEPIPTPILSLEPLALVEVSNDALQEAIGPVNMDTLKDTKKNTVVTVVRPISSFRIQQALLRAIIDTLMEQLYQAKDHLCALALKARCATIALLQRWHRQHRQRVVNAVFDWSQERQAMVWHLTIGVPMPVQAAA